MATINGKPWQYPTAGSYLPAQSVKKVIERWQQHTMNMLWEHWTDFLGRCLGHRWKIHGEGKFWSIFELWKERTSDFHIPSQVACNSFLVRTRLLQQTQICALKFRILRRGPTQRWDWVTRTRRNTNWSYINCLRGLVWVKNKFIRTQVNVPHHPPECVRNTSFDSFSQSCRILRRKVLIVCCTWDILVLTAYKSKTHPI
jgi:hypothetical protein